MQCFNIDKVVFVLVMKATVQTRKLLMFSTNYNIKRALGRIRLTTERSLIYSQECDVKV